VPAQARSTPIPFILVLTNARTKLVRLQVVEIPQSVVGSIHPRTPIHVIECITFAEYWRIPRSNDKQTALLSELPEDVMVLQGPRLAQYGLYGAAVGPDTESGCPIDETESGCPIDETESGCPIDEWLQQLTIEPANKQSEADRQWGQYGD